MKKLLLAFLCAFFACTIMNAQSFSDDFESYDVNAYLGASSPNWTTWSGNTGNSEDVRITDNLAYSGEKSIYFSSTSGNGGPQDVVLYFGGDLLTTGVLTNTMAMNVVEGKSAYFNYQGRVTIGQTWTMNMNFANGVGVMDDPAAGTEMSFLYPEGKWFELTLRVDLSANKWQIFVDGECQGTMENRVNAIASIDLYPLNGSAFYIDDFSYDYNPESPEITNDAGVLLDASYVRGLVGTNVALNGTITNNSTEPITEFTVEVNGANISETFNYSDDPIQPGGSVDVSISTDYKMVEGSNPITLSITSVNGIADADQDPCNDRSSVIMTAVTPAPNKRIIIEEGTGTWCGFCPRGAVFLDRLTAKYPERFISIAVHNGNNDPMVVPAYDNGLDFRSFPNSTLNRSVEQDPSALETPFLEAVVEPAKADFEIGALLDETNRLLKISVLTNAFVDISSSHRLNVILKENGVTGTSLGYAQANYFTGDDIDMGGYEDLPNPVPASMMVYDHVARALITDFEGDPNSYPDGLTSGEDIVQTFSYTIPEEFDIEELEIVAMLLNPNGTINNGAQATIEHAVENGYRGRVSTHDLALQTLSTISPNPSPGPASIRFHLDNSKKVSIDVLDMTGRVLHQRDFGQLQGKVELNFDGGDLENGIYLIKVNTDQQFFTKRLMIQK